MTCPIPEMTDPLGRHWLQPKREELVIDETHALMSMSAFARLSDYSRTNPSGVYPGKMWRRQVTHANHALPCGVIVPKGGWILCWYGEPYPAGHEWHGSVANGYRAILVT